MSMRIGAVDQMSPAELAQTFEPVEDPPPPPKRLGPELLAKLSEDGADLVIDELRDGALYALLYRGKGQLNGHVVSTLNDQWCKWRDGKVPGPLVMPASEWRFVELPPGVELLPYVATAKERPDMPQIGDWGAITEARDPGIACQQLAEIRGYLTNRAAKLVELPSHLLRDAPAALLVELAERHLSTLQPSSPAATEQKSARSGAWFAPILGAIAGGVAAGGLAALGRILGWW